MEQQSFLIGFAQIALVLTGFVSVFVVFQIDHGGKSRVNTHHATSILLGSLVAFLGTLIPMAIYNFDVDDAQLWWWSSAALLALGVVFFLIMFNMTVRLTKTQFKEAGYLHMFSSYAMGFVAAGCLAWNMAFSSTPGFYLLALILNLLVALVGFVTFSVQKILFW